MQTIEKLTYGVHYNSNPQIKSEKTQKIVRDFIEKLLQGTPDEVKTGNELKAILDYQGSQEAIDIANCLHRALVSPDGRKAAGLPAKKRGLSYRTQAVKRSDPIMLALQLREEGLATDADVEEAATGHLGLNCDDRTKKKFIEELLPRVKVKSYWGPKIEDFSASNPASHELKIS